MPHQSNIFTKFPTLSLSYFNSLQFNSIRFNSIQFNSMLQFELKSCNCLVFLALDAAAPLFENEHVDVRLDRTDASFVDAIHTDSKTFIVSGYGMKNPFGHLDFYPNGGYEQKHCRKRDDGLYCRFVVFFEHNLSNEQMLLVFLQ